MNQRLCVIPLRNINFWVGFNKTGNYMWNFLLREREVILGTDYITYLPLPADLRMIWETAAGITEGVKTDD